MSDAASDGDNIARRPVTSPESGLSLDAIRTEYVKVLNRAGRHNWFAEMTGFLTWLDTVAAPESGVSEKGPFLESDLSLDARLALVRLERFIDFDYNTGTKPRPMYVTANGVRQEMPARFHADALALRAVLERLRSEPKEPRDG